MPPERNQVQNVDLKFSINPINDDLLSVGFIKAREQDMFCSSLNSRCLAQPLAHESYSENIPGIK